MTSATAMQMVQMTRPCVVFLRTLPVHVPSKRLRCCYLGFLNTRMTESPLKNSLLINLSLFTGLAPFLPLPVLGTCSTAHMLSGRTAKCDQVADSVNMGLQKTASCAQPNTGCSGHHLCPHLFHILEYHVAVSVERLDSPQQLSVVPAVDQYLRVALDTGCQYR